MWLGTLCGGVYLIISVLVSGFYSWNLNNSELLAMFLAVMGCGYVAMWQAEAGQGPQSARSVPAASSLR